MELKLVYRVLRKISDWTLAGYYSDVYVEGQENVSKDAPLILAACHHNEMIDIATLAATIPHRRHLAFWAKASMFKHPVTRGIMTSSGAIPVYRNPNSTPSSSTTTSSSATTATSETSTSKRAVSLFESSSEALHRRDVLGVFPEGTSYTEPRIVQLKDGAAWAAVEYLRYLRTSSPVRETSGLVIVPVGIVYTDKAQYQSRMRVRYGKPIDVDAVAAQHFTAPEDILSDDHARVLVRALTGAIEKALVDLTINAPDWDALYAARMAREIQHEGDDSVQLRDWVGVTQSWVDTFADKSASPSPRAAQNALLRYYSLLHYTGIRHADLAAVLPATTNLPSIPSALARFTWQSVLTLLHPRALLFWPVSLLHIPAYAMGSLAARLAPAAEEESPAQFKAVVGGLGAGLVYTPLSLWASRALLRLLKTGELGRTSVGVFQTLSIPTHATAWFEGAIQKAGHVLLSLGRGTSSGRAGEAVGTLGVAYLLGYSLARWHNALITDNHRRIRRSLAAGKILLAALFGRETRPSESDSELAPYLSPPLPAANPFVKPKDASGLLQDERPRLAKGVSSRRLIRPLLRARSEAVDAMRTLPTR